MSALHLSAYEGDANIVRGRIELGQDPHARDEDGRTPLHWAAAGGHQALVEYLAGLPGALINTQDEDGLSPLASAVAANKIVVAAFLLGKGADPKARTNSGQAVLHFHKARPEVIRLLLPYLSIADVNAQDKWGNTPLHRCICGESQDHLDALDLLLEAGGRPNTGDNTGNTPLHRATEEGLKKLASRLIEAGADASWLNKEGEKAAP
ncbi:unnamed protein product [Ectocarpus sp. 12 AP-2014]